MAIIRRYVIVGGRAPGTHEKVCRELDLIESVRFACECAEDEGQMNMEEVRSVTEAVAALLAACEAMTAALACYGSTINDLFGHDGNYLEAKRMTQNAIALARGTGGTPP